MIRWFFVITLLSFWMLSMAGVYRMPVVFAATPVQIPFAPSDVPELVPIGVDDPSDSVAAEPAHLAFRKILERVLDFTKIILVAIAVFIVFNAGSALVHGGDTAGEVFTKQKSVLLYLVVGLVLITISETAVDKYFPLIDDVPKKQDEYLGGFLKHAEQVGPVFAGYVAQLVNYFLSFLGGAAILLLILSALQLLGDPASDEKVTKLKKTVTYMAIGIVAIAVSETVINSVVYVGGGYGGVDVERGIAEVVGLSNYVLGFIGVVSAVMIVIAGFYLLVHFGDDDKVATAKRIMTDVVIGAIVAYSSYTVVATIVNVLQ